MKNLSIALLEPYYTGSHKFWADTLKEYSIHQIQQFTLKGQHWKWRMQAAAIPLAQMINASQKHFDLILCSDMMDLSLFKGLLEAPLRNIPLIYYMHENQLSYPYSHQDRDKHQEYHYGFINYKSCMVADKIVFNSIFHKDQFLSALEHLLKRLPDYKTVNTVSQLNAKSTILPIALDVEKLKNNKPKIKTDTPPVLLWNHRWEHDKRPDLFIRLCNELQDAGHDFRINFLGKSSTQFKELIEEFRKNFEQKFIHFGHIDDHDRYLKILASSDILPVCSEHDFFGISVLEAIYSGCYPIVPENMVYSEHFISDPTPYLYTDYDDLLQQTAALIEQPSSFDQGLIRNYSISEVIPNYDLYFLSCL